VFSACATLQLFRIPFGTRIVSTSSMCMTLPYGPKPAQADPSAGSSWLLLVRILRGGSGMAALEGRERGGDGYHTSRFAVDLLARCTPQRTTLIAPACSPPTAVAPGCRPRRDRSA
jgi:hypothetical protein